MKPFKEQTVLTVSQLTRSIKYLLESEYRFIRISGEISNLRSPFSGHSYFTLKDSSSQIRAVVFKQQKKYFDITLQDGQEVLCLGRISVYEPRGEYQIIIDSIELFGTGKLRIAFEQLKSRLLEKGYFSVESKKTIPPFPNKIVVISSPTGAAIQDFLKVVNLRRSPVVIQILPVRVQGKEASTEIARAIQSANSMDDVDIIVLCRGGGSLEDLWAFNEEIVAEEIFRSKIPIVTGIGHEIDTTIADYCADLRSATPTAAAENIIPDAQSLRQHLQKIQARLNRQIDMLITRREQQLVHAARILGNLDDVFRQLEYRLQLSSSYLYQAINNKIQDKAATLQATAMRLQKQAPDRKIVLQAKHIELYTYRLLSSIQLICERKQAALSQQAALLQSVSPLATIARGYSIVRKYDHEAGMYRVLLNSSDTKPGESLNVILAAGSLDCVVETCHEPE